MPTTSNTTIGVSLGSRYVGTAVLVGTELRDWRIRVIRGETLIDKLQRLTSILARLLDTYCPTSIVIKKVRLSSSSSTMDRLQLEAREFLRQHGVTVHEYTLYQLKARLLPGGRVNKTKLVESIVFQFPVLFQEWEREKSLKHSYRIAMYEAVALANTPDTRAR